ncbi:copper amine oxidase [Aspergillus costaricaensis CBS 115574]|uniref:Copper amine oxidase n=1 Tax=Aspergillus costaricaensis CBS 115574 TaxID=1448317 RepID=A0ACD1ID97_9EURO|nr:copper amine oxidase [Aspergillus costaricaensis CBS 115574]RAK88253.1 copper amine oxidase [Aspergillus costaricaensis CBS 115574]
MSCHPLDPASPDEIRQATDLVKAKYNGISLHFKAAGLEEPAKAALVDFLDAEHHGRPLPFIPRQIFLIWYIEYTPRLFEGIVDLSRQTLVHHRELPRDFHGPVDRAEMNEAAQVVMKDLRVQAEIKRLQIDETTVVLDPWDYGVDGEDTQTRRTQVFMYMRNPENNDPDSSHYSFPLDFMVIVDLCKMEVIKIIRLPLGSDQTATAVGSAVPHRRTNPVEPEYDHRLQKNPPRTTLKPYQVVQPEGASFTVNGYLIEWEKWRFRVGFNWREGMTLHDVSFDGKSAFYRLSLSEIFVPYGDPRNPIYRKGAFDLGNVGAGVTANNLQLGCDCLGLIKYLDGCVVAKDGSPAPRPNAICIHEIDNGIQWKHTNHRTGKATVVRKRQLVLQTIITVANYEYIFMWYFDQSGELTFETRATGILSTQPIDKDAKVAWGTRVADGVMAPYHQHLFNLRIDPAMGGHKNSFASTDTVPLPWDEDLNPLGTGFITQQQILDRAGTVEDDISKGRVFKILNENVENPVSLTPIGYKLVPHRSQMLLARPGSWHSRRSEFCESPIWVTKYKDRQLFPAGDYTNQSLGGTGIKSWIGEARDLVRDDDIVIWHTYGFTHNPRVEDFPVMPAEMAQVQLSPYNFCLFNPANDVPPSTQAFNKSVELTEKPASLNSSGCCSQPKSHL